MAQKQYEYFGNRNTVQGNPVLANRYARGQVYGQRLANDTTGQSAWSKDPWFQFGSAIGQAWGDNYNERGIANGKKDMNEFVNSYLGQYAENPTQAQQPQGPLNELDSRNISGNLNYNGPDDWKGELMNGLAKGTQLGELAKKMNAPSGNPLDPSNVGANLTYFTKDGDWNLQQPDLGGARLMYKYNKYKDSDNPDSEALQNKQDIQQLNQMGNNIDFGKVDKEDLRQKLEQHLLNDKGRTPVQTATILGEFDKIYDSKMSQWKQGKATDLVAKGRKALENGNYELAMTNFAAAGEYDSKIASPLMQVANNSWQRKMQTDQYNMSKQIELAKNGLMLDENGKVVRDPSSPIWNQAKYGGVGGGRGGRATKSIEYDENGNPVVRTRKTKKDGTVVEEGELSKEAKSAISDNRKTMDELVKRNGGADIDSWLNRDDAAEYTALMNENKRLIDATRPIYLYDNDGGSADYSGQGVFNDLADIKHEQDIAEGEQQTLAEYEKEKRLEEQRRKARVGNQNMGQWFTNTYIRTPNK